MLYGIMNINGGGVTYSITKSILENNYCFVNIKYLRRHLHELGF